ncbi:hypothetical protein NUSPORA_00998 [Nucleospora cyclopteri]
MILKWKNFLIFFILQENKTYRFHYLLMPFKKRKKLSKNGMLGISNIKIEKLLHI